MNRSRKLCFMTFYVVEYIFVWNIYLYLFVTFNSLKILIVELKT